MAALTNSRNTPELADGGRMQVYPVEADTTVFLGSIVALNANGNAVPASSVSSLKIIGRAEMTYGGTPGQDAVNAGAAGAISILARRGVFMYSVNDASIAEAQIGQLAYAVDDNSVSASNGAGATVVTAQSTAFPASSSAQVVALGHENVSNVRVHSTSGGGTNYTEGVDYTVDYQAGLVMLIAGSAIAAAATVFVDYTWGSPTRSVAGRIVNLDRPDKSGSTSGVSPEPGIVAVVQDRAQPTLTELSSDITVIQMEITAANLTALFTGFDVIFQRGFERPPSYYEQIATVVRSTSRQTVYPWLGRTTHFREWLGDRVVQALETHSYTIVNKDFEDTISISRNDIEDDNYGVYEPVIEQLGWDAKVHPDVLLFNMIKSAVTTPSSVLAYDNLPFFSASHPVGPLAAAGDVRDSTASNLNSSGTGPYWYLIDASRVVRPFIFQLRREYTVTRMNTLTDEGVFNRREFRFGVDARANTGVGLWQLAYASNTDLSNPSNYGAARAAMRSIKTDAGTPFGALAGRKNIYLLVPPALEEVASQLLHSDFMVGTGTSSSVSTGNIWKNTAELVVSEYLS